MPIQFRCTNCEQVVSAPDSTAGQPGRCPHCSGLVTIPKQSSETQDADETWTAAEKSIPAGPIPPGAPLKPDSVYTPLGARSAYGIPAGGPHLRAHRGPTVLTLGMLSLTCGLLTGSGFLCCLFMPISMVSAVSLVLLATPAIVMGFTDLQAMNKGTMDIEGKQMTTTGIWLAAAGIAVVLLGLIAWVLVITVSMLSNVVNRP